MNIIEKQGNLLVPSTYLNEEDSNRELNGIHGCNAQGIMGAGLALQVRSKSEEVYQVYKQACDTKTNDKQSLLGTITFKRLSPDPITIINAIIQLETGVHKRQVNYEAVAQVFDRIATTILNHPNTQFTLAIPKYFGSALAGGNWNIIRTIIEESLNKFSNVNLYIVEYKK